MSYPYLLQGSNITVVINNKPHTVSKTHPTFEKIKQAIKNGEWDKVANIIDPKKQVLDYGVGRLSIQGETLFWDGHEFHNAMSKRMFQMLQEDMPIDPLVKFMENLMDNPSYRSVNELYGFLEKNNLPITPDGHFLAYKKVRSNYMDIHSGKFDNSVGKVCEMPRNMVDDNANQTCSSGLHFCSQDYLKHFGGSDSRVVIVKINPRDVVSIPTDYDFSKGRCSRYEVIGEVGVNVEDDAEFTSPVQSNANSVKIYPSPGPKVGNGEFIRGYTAGFNMKPAEGPQASVNYIDGYKKGYADARDRKPQQYLYLSTSPFRVNPQEMQMPCGRPQDQWPFPTGN
jgi:hypothetical protein